MTLKAFREVGECGCAEYQAGARMRELVRSLQEEVRSARRTIEELKRGRPSLEKSGGAGALLGMRFSPLTSVDVSEPRWIRPY